MKINLIFTGLALLFFNALALPVIAQNDKDAEEEAPEKPGDNFSLEGAIALFRESESLEDFEKRLNSEEQYVNNLDLNEDGETDYIRVEDHVDGDVHAIILQAVINKDESQDVAVIEIEKTGAEEAMLQIIGDEDLYGASAIVEPFEEEVKKDGRHGPAVQFGPMPIIINVWLWNPVRFIYRPGYTVYVSPWRFGVYPRWWRPYRPRPYGVVRVRVAPYRTHYRVVTTHRVVRAHRVYTPVRTRSTVVKSRTVVRGPHGKVRGTKTTTTVSGPRGGKVTKSKTTVRRPRRN